MTLSMTVMLLYVRGKTRLCQVALQHIMPPGEQDSHLICPVGQTPNIVYIHVLVLVNPKPLLSIEDNFKPGGHLVRQSS